MNIKNIPMMKLLTRTRLLVAGAPTSSSYAFSSWMASLPQEEKHNVTLKGWASSVNKRGQLVFVKLVDGRSSGTLQIVVPKTLARNLQVGCAVSATGKWQRSEGSQQPMELVADEFRVIASDKDPRYDGLSSDALRKKLHLRAHSSGFSALLRARSNIFQRTHNFFLHRDFVHVDTPTLTRNDCEAGGEVFVVSSGDGDRSGKEETQTYLTVSAQLHLEALVSRLSKVYTVGAAFRAEKQQSHTHLCEFRMLEVEVAFIETVEDLCSLAEEYAREMISVALNDSILRKDIEEMNGTLRDESEQFSESMLTTEEWPRIKYDTAIDILVAHGQTVSVKKGLSKQNEMFLVEHHGGPVFVTHFPSSQKPFYMKRNDEGETLSFDLLCPIIGELAGGSIREDNADKLAERGCHVDWYLETRRRGQPTSGGFGIGFERLLQLLFSVRNIKDTVAFPRWHKHCQC